MARRPLSARIAPGIELQEIVIRLSPFGPPTALLKGVVDTQDRRVARSSSVQIETAWLPTEGEQFIEAMRVAFAASTRHPA